VNPHGIAIEPDGDIIVADISAFGGFGGVIRVDPVSGDQTRVSSGGSFVGPLGVALEPDGRILVADYQAFGFTGGLIRVDPVTGEQTTVASGGLFRQPHGVALEADREILVTDPGAFTTGAVIRVDPVTGAQTALSSDGSRLLGPAGIAIVPRRTPSLPTSKDECKNGGWRNYGFKNQGRCLVFVFTAQVCQFLQRHGQTPWFCPPRPPQP
jgi:hypothetical protein